MRAEFRQELWNSEGQLIERAAGTLSLKRAESVSLWSYREPIDQLVVADGENLWIYDVELAQATVTAAWTMRWPATPAMLLSGDQVVRDGFDVLESFTANDIEWVRLAPKLEGTDFRSVLIGFKESALDSLELVDGLDQVTFIQFTEVEINPDIEDERFDFSPPEGVDVIGRPSGSD